MARYLGFVLGARKFRGRALPVMSLLGALREAVAEGGFIDRERLLEKARKKVEISDGYYYTIMCRLVDYLTDFASTSTGECADYEGRKFVLEREEGLVKFVALPEQAVSAKGCRDSSMFLREYRRRLEPLHAPWDLTNLVLRQSYGARPSEPPDLDTIYLPLRLAKDYSLNALDQGEVLNPEALLERQRPLVVRGAAGTGKTTWLRWNFRRLIKNEQALPIMVELRRLAQSWSETGAHGEERSLDAYIEDWVREHMGPDWEGLFRELIGLETGPRPVLLVDGWDELGDLGEELRTKLVGFMQSHPRLLVVASSRPYGQGRPSSSDGFEVLDIQPLSDDEVEAFAGRFFECYYPEKSKARQERLDSFLTALERSPAATALARTPLFLTMMLVLSGEGSIPEKRHKLYYRLVELSLAILPDQYEKEGVRPQPEQWRPEDELDRLRAVAALAFEMQSKHATGYSRWVTIPSWEEIVAVLPSEWQPKQRHGFLAWLVSRTGLLSDHADGTVSFAHLGFQEYLTAWHLNDGVKQEQGRVSLFVERSGDGTWWETLRLWAAMIDEDCPNALEPVLEGLLAQDEGTPLTGAILADGLGDSSTFECWRPRFTGLLVGEWSGAIEHCARAWAANRDDRRRRLLQEHLTAEARRSSWAQWLRINEWSLDALSIKVPLPQTGTNARRFVRALRKDVLKEHDVAVGRVLSGLVPFWPGTPVEYVLLHAWPSQRRLAGIRLQNLANMGAKRCDLMALGRHILTEKPCFERVRAKAREWVCDLAEGLTRDPYLGWGPGWEFNVPRALTLHWAEDWDYSQEDCRRAQAKACLMACLWVRSWDCHIARESEELIAQSDWVQARCPELLEHVSPLDPEHWLEMLTNHWSARDLQHWTRAMARAWAWNLASLERPDKSRRGDIRERYSGLLPFLKEFRDQDWYLDFAVMELLAAGRACQVPFLAAVRDKPEDERVRLLIEGSRISCGMGGDTLLFRELLLASYSKSTDPLWAALAKHIARLSTKKDRDLLQRLAKHPEKRDPPLQWGLKYIVRGDVVLDDGTEVELDQLARELDMKPLPFLEDVPQPLEVDWSEVQQYRR